MDNDPDFTPISGGSGNVATADPDFVPIKKDNMSFMDVLKTVPRDVVTGYGRELGDLKEVGQAAMHHVGQAVLGAMNLPQALGISKAPPTTSENFLPLDGVQQLIQSLKVPSAFSPQSDDVQVIDGHFKLMPRQDPPMVPDNIAHFMARGAHEVITPDNVGVAALGAGLPVMLQKALGIGFGAQQAVQVPQQLQQGDKEGALLSAVLAAGGLGASALPERAPIQLKPEDIQSRLAPSDVAAIDGAIPPSHQLPPPKRFITNELGQTMDTQGGEVKSAIPDYDFEPDEPKPLPPSAQERIVGKDIRQKEEGKFSPEGENRLYAGMPADEFVKGLIRKVWDKAVPVVGETESYTDKKTGLTVEGIKPGTAPEEIQSKMQAKITDDIVPAVVIDGKLVKGLAGDTHADIIERAGGDPDSIPHEDPRRGFAFQSTPIDKLITRPEAEDLTGIKGTAEAGGLDSQDLPGAVMKRLERMVGEEDAKPMEKAVGDKGKAVEETPPQTFKLHSGIPIPGLGKATDAAELASKAFKGFMDGRYEKERMAQLYDGAYNQAKDPEHLQTLRKEWIGQLREMKMPGGKPLVDTRVMGEAPIGFVKRDFMGTKISVNKDIANAFDSLTSESGVRRNPVGNAILKAEGAVKHGLLLADTFHVSRVAQRTFFLTGDIPRFANKSLIEYTPEEMTEAFKKGLVDKSDVDYYEANHETAMKLVKGGLNAKVWADNLGLNDKGIFKKLEVNGFDVNPLSRARQFNRWVFDTLSRSALVQVGLYEFERTKAAHPEWSEEQVISHTVKQSNIYLGNLGRQGVLKSQTMQDLARIAFLAPQWVESMVQSEARAYKQAGQVPVDLALGKGLNVGTQAKGIGTAVVAYFVVNQIINMATQGHPTWENKQKGHKFDAFIPAKDPKSQGFWLSPFSMAAEFTHDYERYGRKGKSALESTAEILGNKLSPLARSAEVFRTGRDYAGRRLDSGERAKEMVKALNPTPLPATGMFSDTPGQTQRQLFASAGFKLEPKGRYEDLQDLTFKERLKKVQEYREQRGAMDPASKVRSVEESVFRQQERAKAVMKSLDKGDRNFLESRGIVIPGFASNVRVGRIDVPLTEDEVQELSKNVTTGTKQIINRLKSSDAFSRMKQEAQQEVFNSYMRGLVSAERQKITRNMGRDAQNLGTTDRKYKILQQQ